MTMQAPIAANDAADVAAPSTILVERESFLNALAFLDKSVTERKNTIPILSGCLFRPAGEGDNAPFTITGTDLDITATVELAGVWETPLPFVAADVAALHSAVKAISADTVTLELVGASVKVSGGGSVATLATLPAADFPEFQFGDTLASFTLPGRETAIDLARVGLAVSTEETRYYLNGIHLHRYPDASGEVLRFAATDGHRLCVQSRPLPDGAADLPGDIIIPRKACAAVAKAIGKLKPEPKSVAAALKHGGMPDVHVVTNAARMAFRIGRYHITTRLIDGTFPDYTRVIPSQNDRLLTVDAKALARAVKSAASATKAKSPAVRLDIEPERVRTVCYCPENGTGTSEIAAEFQSSEGVLEIGFNSTYLADVAGLFAGESIVLHLADAAAPTLITSPADTGFLAVLMPMRVDSAPSQPAARDAEPAEVPETAGETFARTYGEAFEARDGAAMRAAVEAYRPDLAAAYRYRGYGAPKDETNERAAKYVLAQKAEAVRAERGCSPKRYRPYRLHEDAAHVASSGFVATGMGQRGVRSPSSFKCLNDYETRVRHLATLPGYDPADPRAVLPVLMREGETKLIRAESLRNLRGDYLPEVSPSGRPVTRRRGSPGVWRSHIIGVVMPKLKADETAAMLFAQSREIAALKTKVAELTGLVDDLMLLALREQPAAPIAAPAVDIEPPAPASVALEPEPAPAAPDGPAVIVAALSGFGAALAPPVIAGFNAPGAGEIARLEAGLAESEAARAQLRGEVGLANEAAVTARREIDSLVEQLATARRQAADNLALAQEQSERAVAATRRADAAEAKLARFSPIMSALAGLKDDPQPPKPALVDASGRALTVAG